MSSPPPRVQAALQFIAMMNVKENGMPSFDGSSPKSGELTFSEKAAYNSAIKMLQQYFSCEMDFGDYPPLENMKDDEDGGQVEFVKT